VGSDTTRVKPYRPEEGDGASMAAVEIVRGSLRGKIIALEPGASILGRAESAEVRMDDDGVSRQHARITLQDGIALLADLESTNGTFVNGARVGRLALRDGDRIDLGPEASLRFGHYRADEIYRGRTTHDDARDDRPDTEREIAEPSPLTARELDIARLVADGASNADIGKRLFISPRTVGTHLANIYQRLDIHTRAELTRYLLERKLL
jgi:DNA-binding CsgD family transcriptional regulator